MLWSTFSQTLILFCLGAHIYSCGRTGQQLLTPVLNGLQRTMQALRPAREQEKSIAPNPV